MHLYILRTAVLYLLLIAVIRLMGKRQVGQLEPSEFVVTMLVANLATLALEQPELGLGAGVVSICTVLALELGLSLLSLKSLGLRRLLCGQPVILIENGRILQSALRKSRITLDELLGQLREKEVLDPRSVQFAILETNGNLSVFPFPSQRPATAREAGVRTRRQELPVALIVDGRVLRQNLRALGRSQAWLERQLRKRGVSVRSTWLMTADKSGKILLYKKDDLL